MEQPGLCQSRAGPSCFLQHFLIFDNNIPKLFAWTLVARREMLPVERRYFMFLSMSKCVDSLHLLNSYITINLQLPHD